MHLVYPLRIEFSGHTLDDTDYAKHCFYVTKFKLAFSSGALAMSVPGCSWFSLA